MTTKGAIRRGPRRRVTIGRRGSLWAGAFEAMASPCEVLVDGGTEREARGLAECAAREAWRIERTFSRYRDDNVVHRINTGAGRPLDVDAETARLLDFAARCHALSGGLFDVTSGVLRRAWSSGATMRVPDEDEVRALLALVGWQKVDWSSPRLTLPAGMQVDFGGIGKEYAVDRVVALLAARSARPLLVNFGGDLHASAPPASGAWQVGVESIGTGSIEVGPAGVGPVGVEPADAGPTAVGPAGVGPAGVGPAGVGPAGVGPAGVGSAGVGPIGAGSKGEANADPSSRAARPIRTAAGVVALRRGAMATSGDARRHATRDGVRYGHVLNPLTGWPVPDAPRSVTVVADSCTQAGLLATLALLHGAGAEALLEGEGVTFRIQRDGT